MKKLIILLFILIVFPASVYADNSECILKNTSTKSSFVPNEIITVDYGLTRMPSGYFGYMISFVISYNTEFYEIIKQDGKLAGISNKWETIETETFDPGFGDGSYEYIKITASTNNPELFLLPGTIYEESYIIGNIKFKVKEKAISDVTEIYLSSGLTGEEDSSMFYQHLSTSDGIDEEGNEVLVPDTGSEHSFPCEEKIVTTKIVNKNDDAYLNKLTLTIEADTKTVKEITEFNSSDIEVLLPQDTKKVTIETSCRGKNCTVDSIKEFNMEGESIYPVVVTSDNSIRTYYLIFVQSEIIDDNTDGNNEISNISEVSNTNKEIKEEKSSKTEKTGAYIYIILIILSIAVVTLFLILYFKKRKKDIVIGNAINSNNSNTNDNTTNNDNNNADE